MVENLKKSIGWISRFYFCKHIYKKLYYTEWMTTKRKASRRRNSHQQQPDDIFVCKTNSFSQKHKIVLFALKANISLIIINSILAYINMVVKFC